jgi:hypothetical protein
MGNQYEKKAQLAVSGLFETELFDGERMVFPRLVDSARFLRKFCRGI